MVQLQLKTAKLRVVELCTSSVYTGGIPDTRYTGCTGNETNRYSGILETHDPDEYRLPDRWENPDGVTNLLMQELHSY